MTSHENYAIHAIPIRPAAFVQKPVTFQKIARALDDMLYYRDISRRIFKCTSNKSLVHVQVSHIRYLNSCGRKVYLQTTDSRISFYGKLSEVQQEPCFSSFIQIHKSYLVNPDYIDHISSNTVFLQGSSHEQLPISRAYQPLVEQWLMKARCHETVYHDHSNIFHIYAVYQFSQLLFQKDPSRKRTEILAYIGYFLLNSGCFILFHNIVINILSNILLFFCITLLYPTTWAHRILATVSIYIISMAADILCTTISIWCEYTLFFTSGFAASLLMLIIARMSLHFHLSKNDVIPRLNIFYVFTAIFIPLGSILLAHYIARTLSWRSLAAAIVLLLINVSVFSLYDRMIHLIQEHHTALLIEKQNKAYQQQAAIHAEEPDAAAVFTA